jgi:hypothetical protein
MSTPQIIPDYISDSVPLNHGADDCLLADNPKNRRIASLRYSIRYELDSLSRIIVMTERTIVKEQQRQENSIINELTKFKPETGGYFFAQGFFKEDLQRISEDLPRILRYALFSSMISLAETSFVRIAWLVQSFDANAPKFDDKQQGVIGKAVRYINEHGNINESRISSIDTLLKLVAIRNCVVHNDGIIDRCKNKDKDKIRQYIESNLSLIVNGEGRIIFDSSFLKNHRPALLQTLMQYCDTLKRTSFP